MAKVTKVAAEKPAADKKPDPVKSIEIRASVLEKLDDTHTKHVSLVITDQDVVQTILEVLEEQGFDLEASEDASQVTIEPESAEHK